MTEKKSKYLLYKIATFILHPLLKQIEMLAPNSSDISSPSLILSTRETNRNINSKTYRVAFLLHSIQSSNKLKYWLQNLVTFHPPLKQIEILAPSRIIIIAVQAISIQRGNFPARCALYFPSCLDDVCIHLGDCSIYDSWSY